MMNRVSKVIVSLVLIIVGLASLSVIGSPSSKALALAELPVTEIMERVDRNQYMDSSHSVSTLIIKSGKRQMTKQMEAWTLGSEKALVHFLNPQDRGTKYLKIGDELWMFFPDAEDLVKISGHMLKQSMMGSDFSYQDALESHRLTELYDFDLAGTENYEGVDCYVILATAREGAEVSYHTRKIWVDSGRFVVLKEELYAPSGKLLKVSRVEEVREVDGRYLAVRMLMEDKLRKNSSTAFVLNEIEIGLAIPEEMFSLNTLMR